MKASEIIVGSRVPRKGNVISHAWGRIQFKMIGWSFVGQIPDIPKFIMIVAPHTSNWDFIVGVIARAALKLKVSWIGKQSLFKAPLGFIMRYLGGIPVYRDKKMGVVDQVAEAFNSSEQLILAITPEGTRSRREQWKTGFYHMAQKANVPILPVAFDFADKKIIFGEPVLTTDFETDMTNLNDFFSQAQGKNPDDFSAHRF